MSTTEKSPGNKRIVILTKPLPECDRPNAANPLRNRSSATTACARRSIVVCVVIFFVLPLSNLMRFDIPRQRFYFFGYELWISEFAIIFFSLMFLMFVVAAMAMLYGRVYCGYLCPQMIFSEASLALESKLQRMVNKYVRWNAQGAQSARALFLPDRRRGLGRSRLRLHLLFR